jgi:hypothetical protein
LRGERVLYTDHGREWIAWDIDAWLRPRLTEHERAEVSQAVRAAIDALTDCERVGLPEIGMPTATELDIARRCLVARVLSQAA